MYLGNEIYYHAEAMEKVSNRRVMSLADKVKKCEELVGMGALLQVNASSVLGEHGISTN